MATLIVDEFSAKPSGFLARWRYIRVLVDTETHLITNLCVPGKECINLNNLSDYQKISRRYAAGDLITTFCDFVTFERISIFASDTRPFATATIEIDVAACGYLTPLPTPAVPPNPFGTPDYGDYKTYTFCDETNTFQYRITIAKKNYAGLPTEIESADAIPVLQRYSRDNKYDAVVGCEMSFDFIATESFNFNELITDDERQFRTIVQRRNIVTGTSYETYFSGFIVPDLAEEPFKPYPYPVTITITDGIALLKKQSYPVPVGLGLNIQQPFVYMLAYCFAQTGLELDILTVCNLYEQSMLNGADDDPLLQAKANPLRFADDLGNIDSCYTLLEGIAKTFGAMVCQVNGKWTFIRTNELAQDVIRGRVYNYTGLFLYATNLNPLLEIGLDEDVQIINDNARTYRGRAFKFVNVRLKYGFVPSAVYNGNFETWDGANPRYWTPFGGIAFSKVQKSIPGGGGQPVLIDDYCLQFDEVFSAFKFIQTNNLSVQALNSLIVTFNLGSQSGIDELVFRMRVGEYWLRNAGTGILTISDINNNGNYEWVQSGIETATFLTGGVENFGSKDINVYQVQITIPEIPIAGELEVFVVGFRQWNYATKSVNGVSTNTLVPRTGYTPVQIDNFAIAASKNPSENTPDGVLYRSLQDKVFTNSEEIEIQYGDNSSSAVFQSVNFRSALYNPLKNNLHSIFTADNSYSKLWYDYGADSEKLPIGAHLAKGVLKAHQRGYLLIDCDLRGMDVNYLSVFNICTIDGRSFMFLSAEFDLLKNQIVNCTLVEMFRKNIQSQNTEQVNTPATKIAYIPQDQDALAFADPTDYERIFYPQFGEEFT